jgi:hypothetical protein
MPTHQDLVNFMDHVKQLEEIYNINYALVAFGEQDAEGNTYGFSRRLRCSEAERQFAVATLAYYPFEDQEK